MSDRRLPALDRRGPVPGETGLNGTVPWYDVYECTDGVYITLAALEPKFWTTFTEEAAREELIDMQAVDDPDARTALREEFDGSCSRAKRTSSGCVNWAMTR